MNTTVIEEKLVCYHCGDECKDSPIKADNKLFCCEGCKLVYEILNENNMCSYYQLNQSPGISPDKKAAEGRFAYLDDESVARKLINFTDGKISYITFYIPQMHCSSCIWLLENLNRINQGVIRSQVNFGRKEAMIYFNPASLSLRKLVEMLAAIGYEPLINLNDLENKERKKADRSQVYKIGVAGFAFGNIMLFSFPEYFSITDSVESHYGNVFNYINLALSLPVFFYCSSQFFRSAFLSLKQKFLNIDVPIALGILVMFVRSSYEIISGTGAGYMDTMAGLVFFMLLGRIFQNKTYDTLSFERDYKSFFPIAVMTKRSGAEVSVPVSDLKKGDRIVIRNEELIPADAYLLKGEANIDYSFVTGESVPMRKKAGELIYAGGKQVGASIELEVVNEVRQSYLTQLWNSDVYNNKQQDTRFQQLVNKISHYFTIAIVAIAIISLGYWMLMGDAARGWNAFTAVLIIACPCALAISSPFTLGNILRIFGRNKFYLKNFTVIEKLALVDTVVFDKTGTITYNNEAAVEFVGNATEENMWMVRSVVSHSTHPLSRMIFNHLTQQPILPVSGFKEVAGKGISATVNGVEVKVGSAAFTGTSAPNEELIRSNVHVSFDGKSIGYFSIHNSYRKGIEQVIAYLRRHHYKMVVLTGDNEGEKESLVKLFGSDVSLAFRQSPQDKLHKIQALQDEGRNILMIGDGLNDAGALKQSDVGISISDNVNNFSPACDGILDAGKFSGLPKILNVSKNSHRIIMGSFIIALLYNAVGLYFAVLGLMSPLFAAILMPLSSVTIISFTTGMSRLVSKSTT